MADRYRLKGDVLDGQIDLDIVNVRRTDSGLYCCRVDIDGVFNDKKVIMNLRVVKGERFDQKKLQMEIESIRVSVAHSCRSLENCNRT